MKAALDPSMQAYLVRKLVMTITECVDSDAWRREIIQTIHDRTLIIGTRDGPEAAIAYLSDELKSWKADLEEIKKTKRREAISRRNTTTFNMVAAIITAAPSITELLNYLGYLPI